MTDSDTSTASLTSTAPLDVIVSGGSMGGLFTALALRRDGHDVDVYERSTGRLAHRGAGIVAQPRMLRFLADLGGPDREAFTTTTARRQYLAADGTVDREYAETMTFTSWDAVYRLLKAEFGDGRYHAGRRTVDVGCDDGAATLRFADGETASGDLAVVAEGGQSNTRERLLPGASPEYAGYVAWRGVVPEDDVPAAVREQFADTFTFHERDDELVLAYLIPGPDGGTAPGERRLNWVWYDAVRDRSERTRLLTDADGGTHAYAVPPGRLREAVEADRRTAAERFPDAFADLVAATGDPFVQTIYDLRVPEMVFDRVCLLGDAAFVARPHTAAGTAKAAADGVELADALAGREDVAAGLDDWERRRLRAGRRLVAEGVRMGEEYVG